MEGACQVWWRVDALNRRIARRFWSKSGGGELDRRGRMAGRWPYVLPPRHSDAPALVTDAMRISRASGGVGIGGGRELEGHVCLIFRVDAANIERRGE